MFKIVFALFSATLMSTLAIPGAAIAEDACEVARDDLVRETNASPDQLTTSVAEAVARVLETCLESENNSKKPKRGDMEVKVKVKSPLKCNPVNMGGVGDMVVIITVPFVTNVVYPTQAYITYTNDSNGNERLTARDPTVSGFDAGPVVGTIFLAGIPFENADWAVGSACSGNGTVCHVVGEADYVRDIQITMAAELNLCT